MKNKFSKWIKWTERNELGGINYPGIYAIAKSPKSLHGTQFSWRQNIIYIGMTNSKAGLRGRLRQFEDTINGKSGHGGALRVIYEHGTRPKNKYLDLYVAILPVIVDVTELSYVNLLKMAEVPRLEYIAWSEYFKANGRLPQFNDKKTKKA